MSKKNQEAVADPSRAAKKLGMKVLVKAHAQVRMGCTRSFTTDCGISYRGN